MIFMWPQVIFALVLWSVVSFCVLSVFHPIQEESVKQIKSTKLDIVFLLTSSFVYRKYTLYYVILCTMCQYFIYHIRLSSTL